MLSDLRLLVVAHPEIADLGDWLAYLEKREGHMPYPTCLEQGWPMGSGAVESGNKLVVEARLKGAGMHWAREHVNPMLGLRNAVCSDRWDEAWGQIGEYRAQQARERQIRRAQQLLALSEALSDNRAVPIVDAPPRSDAAEPTPTAVAGAPGDKDGTAQPKQPWRPPPDHPWRKYPACTPRRSPHPGPMDAKM